jgi:GNAT superfamily N-acetyltransferase
VSEITVRRALPRDLDAILSLYVDLMEGDEHDGPADREVSLPVLARILLDPQRHLAVALLDGEPAATADLLIVENLTHHAQPWGIVENVVTAASARRTGVGRAVMSYLIELARESGCYKVQLISGKHREEAHAFYRSLGMDAVGEGFKIYLED